MPKLFNMLATPWYEQGHWPMVAATLTFAVTQAVVYWQMVTQARAGLAAQLAIKRIDSVSEQLAQFYNPLFALLSANGQLVQHFGPSKFAEYHDIRAEVAAENWRLIKEKEIIPNNALVAEILRCKSHLMSASDDISHYLQLNNHLSLYKVFNERPTEAIEEFRFPADVLQHISKMRAELIASLNVLKLSKKR